MGVEAFRVKRVSFEVLQRFLSLEMQGTLPYCTRLQS